MLGMPCSSMDLLVVINTTLPDDTGICAIGNAQEKKRATGLVWVEYLVEGFSDGCLLSEAAAHEAHELMQQADPAASC